MQNCSRELRQICLSVYNNSRTLKGFAWNVMLNSDTKIFLACNYEETWKEIPDTLHEGLETFLLWCPACLITIINSFLINRKGAYGLNCYGVHTFLTFYAIIDRVWPLSEVRHFIVLACVVVKGTKLVAATLFMVFLLTFVIFGPGFWHELGYDEVSLCLWVELTIGCLWKTHLNFRYNHNVTQGKAGCAWSVIFLLHLNFVFEWFVILFHIRQVSC
jgi:hypothetical protein